MIDLEQVNISAIAEDAILLTWPDVIAPAISEQITAIQHFLATQGDNKIIETVASYNSLIIYYRFDLISYLQLKELLTAQLQADHADSSDHLDSDIVEIPVYYDGWDLSEISKRTQLSIDEVIDTHSKHLYTAYAHGFVPGFCYLASVDKQLQLPRKATPRQSVPAGAVAIANEQTAVYPIETPGGWHIVGFTPVPLFTVKQRQFYPTINVGQTVKFSPISKKEYLHLGGQIMKEN